MFIVGVQFKRLNSIHEGRWIQLFLEYNHIFDIWIIGIWWMTILLIQWERNKNKINSFFSSFLIHFNFITFIHFNFNFWYTCAKRYNLSREKWQISMLFLLQVITNLKAYFVHFLCSWANGILFLRPILRSAPIL